jgi:hypothetical protein
MTFDFKGLKPFISVLLFVITLLTVVFFQMEERRRGYALLLQTREHKVLLDEKRDLEIKLAKLSRPQLLEKVAQSHFTLKKITNEQIIHLPYQQTRAAASIKKETN